MVRSSFLAMAGAFLAAGLGGALVDEAAADDRGARVVGTVESERGRVAVPALRGERECAAIPHRSLDPHVEAPEREHCLLGDRLGQIAHVARIPARQARTATLAIHDLTGRFLGDLAKVVLPASDEK